MFIIDVSERKLKKKTINILYRAVGGIKVGIIKVYVRSPYYAYVYFRRIKEQ